MLYLFFLTNEFKRFCQSGLYLDFFVKKLSELFVKNFFIYSAQFFGEKFVIEELTKKIFKKILSYNENFLFFKKLLFSSFFIQTLSFFFYILVIMLFFI